MAHERAWAISNPRLMLADRPLVLIPITTSPAVLRASDALPPLPIKRTFLPFLYPAALRFAFVGKWSCE